MAKATVNFEQAQIKNGEFFDVYLEDGSFVRVTATKHGRPVVHLNEPEYPVVVQEYKGAIPYRNEIKKIEETDTTSVGYNVSFYPGLRYEEGQTAFATILVVTGKSTDEKEVVKMATQQLKSYPKSHNVKVVKVTSV
jgi:hypothetical protein